MCIDTEDLDTLEHSAFISDGEDEEDNTDIVAEMKRLDMFGTTSTKQQSSTITNLLPQQKLNVAMKYLCKAAELQKRANQIIHDVSINLNPQEIHENIYPFHMKQTNSKFPQNVMPAVTCSFIPKKCSKMGKTWFFCKICDVKTPSWSGCDSHIRKIHSHLKYGPCNSCKKFTSYNIDSFRGHIKRCQKTK